MRVIALSGRGNVGKTHCLGHLINLIYKETTGCDFYLEGHDTRIILDYHGKRISICTWGDNAYEEQKNIDFICCEKADIAIVATRTKGDTVEIVERFCEENDYELKWVEKYVASFDDLSGQDYLNKLQAEQILDYVRGLIDGQLYYVDSISSIGDEDEQYHVILLGTESSGIGYPRTLSLTLNNNLLYSLGTERRMSEDDFVLYHPDSDNLFENGNETPTALALREESSRLQQELIEKELRGDAAFVTIHHDIDWVKSYHVKVGHGNCSLILSKYANGYELWMVDCSTYDYLNRCDYSLDLYHCLKDIADVLSINLKDLRISRFMLTHIHFDHYNGLSYLIEHGWINGDTVVYANLYFKCASPIWCGILKELNKTNCRIVEPVPGNLKRGAIRVYHPECRLYKNNSDAQKGVMYRTVSEVNNTSVVYGIKLNDKIMVLPGDLESKGFDEMTSNGFCSKDLYNADYYVISHHGSLNGHGTMPCNLYGVRTPLLCASNNLKKAILMGRNYAYPGIYSPIVLRYWNSMHNVLVYTERAKYYLELSWASGNVTYK